MRLGLLSTAAQDSTLRGLLHVGDEIGYLLVGVVDFDELVMQRPREMRHQRGLALHAGDQVGVVGVVGVHLPCQIC